MEYEKYTFVFTKHFRERYCERIIQVKRRDVERYLERNWKVIDGKIGSRLRLKTFKEMKINTSNEITQKIIGKYGKSKFYMEGKAIFVAEEIAGSLVLKTCYLNQGPIGTIIKGW